MVERTRLRPGGELDPSTKDKLNLEALFHQMVMKGEFIHNTWHLFLDKDVLVSADASLDDDTLSRVFFTDPIAKVFGDIFVSHYPDVKAIILTQLVNPDTDLQSMIFFQECTQMGNGRLIAAPYSRFLLWVQEEPSIYYDSAIDVLILDLSKTQYDSKL